MTARFALDVDLTLRKGVESGKEKESKGKKENSKEEDSKEEDYQEEGKEKRKINTLTLVICDTLKQAEELIFSLLFYLLFD